MLMVASLMGRCSGDGNDGSQRHLLVSPAHEPVSIAQRIT